MPIRHRLWFFTAAILLLLLTSLAPVHRPVPMAFAQTTVVTSPDDSGEGTLRAIVDAIQNDPNADPNQEILFNTALVRVIVLNSPIEIDNVPVTINGTGGVQIQSRDSNAIFDIRVDTTLENLLLRTTGGNPGNGVRHRGGALTITDTTFEQLTPNYALLSTNGTVELTSVNVIDVVTAEGAIRIEGSSSISLAQDLDMTSNEATGNGRGALTINTSSNAQQRIIRSIFKTNTGDAQVSVVDGNVSLVNSIINDGIGSGLRVGTAGTATLSFVTIGQHTSVGINNPGTVNMANSANNGRCNPNGNPINLQGRNFFLPSDGCDFTPASSGFRPPSLNLSAGVVPTPAADSPLVNRVDPGQCQEFGNANVVLADYNSSLARQGVACDVGAIEISENSITGGEIAISTLTNIAEINIIEGASDFDDNLIRFVINTFPVADVQFAAEVTGDSAADCELDDGTGSPTSGPVLLTFNENNWDTGGVFLQLRAVDDTDSEGDHTCDITITYASSTDPLYNSIADELLITDLRIIDDDLVDDPDINLDFSAFDAPLLETDTLGRAIVVTASDPPSETIEVWVEIPTGDQDQCEVRGAGESPTNPLLIDASNWSLDSPDRGSEETDLIIAAIDDGVQELTTETCQVLVKSRPASGNTTNRGDENLTIAADGPYRLTAVPSTTRVAEGDTAMFNLDLDRVIGETSSDQFIFDLTVTDSDTDGEEDCRIVGGLTQLVFDNDDGGNETLDVQVVNDGDGGNEAGETCTVTLAFNEAASGGTQAVPLTVDLVITIEDDPVDSFDAVFNVQVVEVVNDFFSFFGGDRTTLLNSQVSFASNSSFDLVSTTVLEELGVFRLIPTDYVVLSVGLAQPVDEPITVRFRVTQGQGNCAIFNLNNPLSPRTQQSFTLVDSEPESAEGVVFYPIDDTELVGTYSCTIELEVTSPSRPTPRLLSYTMTVDDTVGDTDQVYTDPFMFLLEEFTGNFVTITYTTGVVERQSIEICYILSTAPSERAVIRFTGRDQQYCSWDTATMVFRPSDGDQAQVCGMLTAKTIPDNFEVAPCRVNASFSAAPSNYADNFLFDPDFDVPDIEVAILNDDPPDIDDFFDDDDDDSNSTAEADSATAIPDATVTPNVTATPEITAVPTAIPVPSVVLIEGVRVLPVRTGPYLGATFVTIAVDQSPAGAPQQYRVLARNNDETADVTWYQIVANGRIGWASGRSLELRNITDAELPVIGSVFDNIEGAPDLGVFGTLTRARAVYRRPSTRAATTGVEIPEGEVVSIIGRTREFPFDDWYQVRWAGQTGWILSESRLEEPAIIVNADIVRESVPVR